MATRDLDRLAKRVRTHRHELYKSRLDAANAAGISKDTWLRVETGREVQDGKLAQIARALGWTADSCVAIAEGGEPVLVDGGGSQPQPLMPQVLDADKVRSAVYEAARKKMPGAPIGDLDGFAEEIVDVLRRTGEVADGE